MNDVIFREYDIRGKVGVEFDIEQSYDLACAIAYYLLAQEPFLKTIALGMDGRTTSPAIANRVIKGFMDSGIDIIFIGTCTSPMLYFGTYTLPVQAGVMITASHNPKEYNGIKISLGHDSVWGLQIQEIKKLYHQKKAHVALVRGVLYETSLLDDYIVYLVEHFKKLQNSQISAIIDCGNGAAGVVIPHLVAVMNWKNVDVMYPEVDGTYPNHDADPTKASNLQELKKRLVAGDAKLGIAFDGDVDRMAAMTGSGDLIPGDKMTAILSKPIAQKNKGAAVVFDISCSGVVAQMLKKWGAKPIMCPTGSSNIKQYMKDNKALFGGELSCHYFFADRFFGFDDAIYAMMRLFEMLEEDHVSLETLLEEFPIKFSSSSIRMPCPEDQKQKVMQGLKTYFASRNDLTLVTIDGVRISFDDTWGLIRASNTEPVLGIRFESGSPEGLEKIKQELYQALQPFFNAELISNYLK